eukprot:UN07705
MLSKTQQKRFNQSRSQNLASKTKFLFLDVSKSKFLDRSDMFTVVEAELVARLHVGGLELFYGLKMFLKSSFFFFSFCILPLVFPN